MKAAIRRKYGPPNSIKIEEIDVPTLKENEVLIKVYATTVNRTDCANLTARPFIMRFTLGLIYPKKIILGTDFAGKIVSVGKSVVAHKIGDRVFGFNDSGLKSHAEYILQAEENIYSIPENIDYKKAAASLEGAHYAYTFIHKVSIKSGDNILINGATGAIGSSLLQFARKHDVKITATCNFNNIDLVKALGADKIIDYTKENFLERDESYDFIFDAVGKSTFLKCKPLLKQKGIYISSELGPYSQNIFYTLVTSIAHKKVLFPIPFNTKITIPYITAALKRGNFKPVIDREYALKDITQAYEYVMSGQKTGNVVINLTKD